MACGVFVPWPGTEPRPSIVKAWSPNHWTDRVFLTYMLLLCCLRKFPNYVTFLKLLFSTIFLGASFFECFQAHHILLPASVCWCHFDVEEEVYIVDKMKFRDFLVTQGLRIHFSMQRVQVWFLVLALRGAKISHASGSENQNIKPKQYCKKFNKDLKNGPHQKIWKK